ncbi:hypothetical protein C8J56DRAFT_1027790 [Mycena floridula]|nr:hypothetical protein C8J56DRAFT_1027790 [Mycena floridula]
MYIFICCLMALQTPRLTHSQLQSTCALLAVGQMFPTILRLLLKISKAWPPPPPPIFPYMSKINIVYLKNFCAPLGCFAVFLGDKYLPLDVGHYSLNWKFVHAAVANDY